MSRLRDRWERLERPARVAVAGLAVLIAIGLALRIALLFAYRPAFVGYFDSAVYLDAAKGALFWDPLRPAGYSMFLRVVHGFGDNLAFTIAVQHVLGIATALLLFGIVRRAGGPPWLGLVPAGVVLLGGDQAFLEHAVLTESLYAFLTAVGVYAAMRCLDSERGRLWPALAGLALGMAATVRLAGLSVLVLVSLWLLLGPGTAPRRRAAMAVTGGLAAVVVLGSYLVAAHDETDRWSFARDGAYHFYGRAATFADCEKFDPPAGTDVLCETTPRSKRPSAAYYIFEGPATVHFGKAHEDAASRDDVDKVGSFGRAAARGQPVDWVRASARDFVRFVSPGSNRGPSPAPSAEDYVRHFLTIPDQMDPNLERAADYYSNSPEVSARDGLYETLRDYAGATRVEGAPLGALLLLALAAPFACRGRERRAAVLLSTVGIGLLVVPVMTVYYDGRFGIPAYGFVAAAAALGAWGIVEAVRRRRAAADRR
jgi:hypothetical protein